MAKNKSSSLSQCQSLSEMIEFFDTHDLGDYWDQMPEADFEVSITTKRHLFAIEEDLADRVTEIARAKHIPSETLINAWLREKIAKLA